MRTKLCLDCLADISHRSTKALYCETCAKRHKSGKSAPPRFYKSLFEKSDIGQCGTCTYYNKLGFCDYAYRTGTLRTVLHPGEALNNPCREFTEKGGKTK